jgi:uncharacterized protein DUF1566
MSPAVTYLGVVLIIGSSLLATKVQSQEKRFVSEKPGTVTDQRNRLMWMAKSSTTEVTFAQAAKLCRELRLAGYTDWRLPTSPELRSLYQPLNKANHNVASAVRFSCLNGWTSETNAKDSELVRTVFFGPRHPQTLDAIKTDPYETCAVCVRKINK